MSTKTFHIPHFNVGGKSGAFCTFSDIVIFLIDGGEVGGPANSIFHATMNITSLGYHTGTWVIDYSDPIDSGIPDTEGGYNWGDYDYYPYKLQPKPLLVTLDFRAAGGGEIEYHVFPNSVDLHCSDNNRSIEFSGTFDNIEDFSFVEEVIISVSASDFWNCSYQPPPVFN